jgi:DNA repair exonuclease SbcCD ATPase subunit
MSSAYEAAVTALYQVAHESFVAERQRLSGELKASGDKLSAARVAKLARPPISAWAVNQLWWRAREAFQEMFETAGQLRGGDLTARGAHRQALAKLSAQARKLLSEGGHAASEGTLRRIEATLSGLAAAGSFDPEPAGALTKDRDPPGFEAFGVASAEPAAEEAQAPSNAQASTRDEAAEAKRAHAEAERARQEAEAERKRAVEARAKRQAARRELELKVRAAKHELTELQHQQERAAKALAAAEAEVERARAKLEAAGALLAAAENDE